MPQGESPCIPNDEQPCGCVEMQPMLIESNSPLEQAIQSLEGNEETVISIIGSKTFALTDDDVPRLVEAFQNNTMVRTLRLSMNRLTDLGVSYFAQGLQANAHLQISTLALDSNRITDVGALALLEILPVTMTSLDLSGNKLTDVVVERLVARLQDLKGDCFVRHIEIREANLTNRSWDILEPYLCATDNCRLRQLHLSGNAFTNAICPSLANILRQNKTLIHLNVANCQFSKNFDEIISAALENYTLHQFPLSIAGKRITTPQLEAHLKQNRKNCTVENESYWKTKEAAEIAIRRQEAMHQEELLSLQREMAILKQQAAQLELQLEEQQSHTNGL